MDILHEDNIVTSVHLRGEEEQEEDMEKCQGQEITD